MRRVDPALPSRRGAGATVRDRVDEARACCLERPRVVLRLGPREGDTMSGS